MATYNGESYLYRQLASILEQLQYNDEVIISDDGSTDDTLKIIASFQDKRIKLLRNPNERSPVSNFQHALLHASGEYIFLSDQDDIWFPNKVNGVLQILKDYDLVVHDCNLQYKDQIIGNHFKIRKSGKGLFKNLFKNRFLGNCMAFRRGILKYALPFPPRFTHARYVDRISSYFIWGSLFYETSFIYLEEARQQFSAQIPFKDIH